MRILQRTNDWFREGVPVRMIRVESLITMWIRLVGCPKITQPLNLEVMEYPMEYLPKAKSLRAGMLDVVLADFKNANAWERGILLQRTMTGYMVFLIDWELESEQCLSSIRLLPRNLAKMAPWVRKIILPGVRDQPNQAKRHRVAQFTMLRRIKSLINIDPFPGKATTARLLLDREPLESARDMAAY